MKTAHIIKRLKEDTAYQEFFKKAMKKFDISSPTDLKDPVRKKEFFDYVDKNYSAKTEALSFSKMSNPMGKVNDDTDFVALREYIKTKYPNDTKLHGLFDQTLKAVQMNSQVSKWKQIQPLGGSMNEAYFPAHGEDSAELKKAKSALANWFKNSIKMGMQNKPLGRQTFDILNDLIEDYASAYAEDLASSELNMYST